MSDIKIDKNGDIVQTEQKFDDLLDDNWRFRLPRDPLMPRYGKDVPLEMRPKLYDKINVDCFFENPQLFERIKEQEADSKRFVERLLDVVGQHEDDAFYRLVEAGVAIERMMRWSEQGSTRCGFLIDCPADAESCEPYKACTISTELAPTEDRWDFVVSTEWHGEWRRLAR